MIDFLFGWFIGIVIVYAGGRLWGSLRAARKWGPTVKFLTEMPKTFDKVREGCVLYDTDSGKFLTIIMLHPIMLPPSDFLIEYEWRDKSADVLLVTDEKWGYKFHPDYGLEILTKYVGDKIDTCVFVPCKIYYSTKPKVPGMVEMAILWSKEKCYVELDHLHAFKASRYLCANGGMRTKEELEELEAVIHLEHNLVELFEGSVEQFADYYFDNCGEQEIMDWCQRCGHAVQISVGGTR